MQSSPGIQQLYQNPNTPFSGLIGYDGRKQITQMLRGPHLLNQTSLVIRIDGACRRNGMEDARAAYGVYVGPNSPYNKKAVLPPHIPQTSMRAEIAALENGLDVINTITERDSKLTQIVIASDCKSLVDGITRYFELWKSRGGYNKRGMRVAYFTVLDKLHERIVDMRYEQQITVWFTHIPRLMNTGADRLAQDALTLAERMDPPVRSLTVDLEAVVIYYVEHSDEDFWDSVGEEASWREEEDSDEE